MQQSNTANDICRQFFACISRVMHMIDHQTRFIVIRNCTGQRKRTGFSRNADASQIGRTGF